MSRVAHRFPVNSRIMAKLNYAVPLPQSSHSEVLEWRFPGRHKQLVLTGKSRAAWHTSFVIPQLNLLLDAGLCVNKLRPKHIFLTHGHSDHTLLTPAFIKRDDPPDIFCPVEMAKALDDFLTAKTILNAGGLRTAEDDGDLSIADLEEDERDEQDERDQLRPSAPPGNNINKDNINENENNNNNKGYRWPHGTHELHSVRPGDVVPLRRTVDFTAEVFACDHNVPCVGYLFRFNSRKLKPEYTGLKGLELKKLRESGVEITASHSTPAFAFLGDTTTATLAAEPQWLRDEIPVVITECSFLWEEHRAQAAKTKHTIWADLEKVIRKWPKTTFVLTHFSLRYTDSDVRRFFAEMQDPPSNIVVWVDGDPEEGQ